MTILVTGAAGFLGRALIERLVAHNYTDIRCGVRRQADVAKLEALFGRITRVNREYCVGNLRHRNDAARAVDGVQLIFHLVAGKKGSAADLFLDSVVASRNLLDAVADRKPMRIVLVSSFGVYGVASLGRGATVNEQTLLEPHPEWRDHYSYAKLRQEQLFREYQQRNGFELVVLRPGVIYGPEGGHISNRVGLTIGNWQLHFGGSNLLPLSYVDNCAEAVVVAGTHRSAGVQVYNVHDNDLPTCREYLRAYRKSVTNICSISVPYFGVQLLSALIAKYHLYSKGQLPATLTPYKAASLWGGNRFDNSKLRSIGWKQLVSTFDGLQRSFATFRTELEGTRLRTPTLPAATKKLNEAPAGTSRPSSEMFVVGAVLGPNSNGSFNHLISTLSTLREFGRPSKLLIFASTNPQHFTNKAEVEELCPDLQWVPDELNKRDTLQRCDVLVSLQDGVPLLLLQAMSAQIPIVTTAVRVPEALRNQQTVTFIRDGDQKALLESLLRLTAQSKRKSILVFASEQTVAKQYSDTYLWGANCSFSEGGRAPKGRALIKKALFSAIPGKKLLEHGSRDRAQIALTIDDGPDPVYTPRILDILRDCAARATFFVVGGAAEQYPGLVMRMKNEGHEVGNHSYSHPYFNRLSWAGAIREIRMARWVLDHILGDEGKLFRPPHGKLSLRSLIPAWAAGQQVVMWNVDLKDYRASTGDVESQLDRTSFSSGDIILYHGINKPALKALPRVIKSALNDGREAVTISELMRH
jgi:nucleoside-diphosphate-sugar epimerase/peptidoglycan/xylan/chitin deacetylase (PgdA/CDA1 family)